MRPDLAHSRKFYGRTKGKSLRPLQQVRLTRDLPALGVAGVSHDENPTRARVNPFDWFDGRFDRLWLEVGFGSGEHLVHQARNNPDIGVIGCEPYINGVATALGKIADAGVDNIRLYNGDVRDMLDVLPDACLDGVFLLYPDPWPKKKHHRRRFVTAEYLLPLARVLRGGAFFRCATDIDDYVRQALEEVGGCGQFDWRAGRADDWRYPWADWYSTRYESKALREGRRATYLEFVRR